MATPIFDSPIKAMEGETATLSTTASHLLVKPNFHEARMFCASQWRLSYAPRIACVKLYTGTAYVDYTKEAIDRVSTTHIPLDAMTTAKTLYIGTTDNTRGFYFNMDGTNYNDNAATLDWEYCYDISEPGYKKLTGTISGALTVGETVTGQTSGATAVLVYSGATYIIVKSIVDTFVIGEDVDGGAQTCDDLTAIDYVTPGTGYFTDVAADSDGTDVAGDTLKQDGLYAFTLPSVKKGSISALSGDSLYWYRFTPSATLSATVDVVDLIPATPNTNYGYMEAGIEYQFSINTDKIGAFEYLATAGTPTLDISWLQH
jgi:hypothetical protein